MSFFQIFIYKRFCQFIRTYGIFSLYLYYNIKVGNIKCLIYIIKVTLLDKCTFSRERALKRINLWQAGYRTSTIISLGKGISSNVNAFSTHQTLYIENYICYGIYSSNGITQSIRKQDDDHAVYREHALYIEKAVYIRIIERIRSYHPIPRPYHPIQGLNHPDRPIQP